MIAEFEPLKSKVSKGSSQRIKFKIKSKFLAEVFY